LVSRGTDSAEVIEDRLAKAEFELSFAPQYDVVIVNDDIETATKEAFDIIKSFINE
jgi:guanylate kinase